MPQIPHQKKPAGSGLTPDQLEPWRVESRIDILLGQADTLERLRRSKDRERKLLWGKVIVTDCREAHPDSATAALCAAKVARADGQPELASRYLNLARKLDRDQSRITGIGYEQRQLDREGAVIESHGADEESPYQPLPASYQEAKHRQRNCREHVPVVQPTQLGKP